MLHVKLAKKSLLDTPSEAYIFLLKENFTQTPELRRVEEDFCPNLAKVLKRHKFTGKRGQIYVATGSKDGELVHFLFAGLGLLEDTSHRELESLRRLIGSLVIELKRLEIKEAALALPPVGPFGVSHAELVKQVVITAHFAAYEFTTFKSDKKNKTWSVNLWLAEGKTPDKAVQKAIEEGTVIGEAANSARRLADLPANIVTPTYVAEYAQKMAKEVGLTCTVFGRTKALELGMGGFCAVDAGSDQEGKFVVLEYSTSKKNAPTIALVGKGVTFDTGGISLKPSAAMKGMKFDMSGAAAVISTLHVIAQVGAKVNVVGIAPLVENMPSGKASRQDDIITFMNGKTAEISNTDAEGRLILADALCYAEKMYKPAVIIDIATLTGACVVALGHFYTAIMTQDDALCNELEKVGQLTGDRLWPLPLDNDYAAGNNSSVADLCNSGSKAYNAGSIIGGFFLSNFVTSQVRWAHLDIAGTAHEVPGISYLGGGATGVGVRLFVEYILSYEK